jgi:hypothetical protein
VKNRLFRYLIVNERWRASPPCCDILTLSEDGEQKTGVELIGIEPTTSGLQSQRSPN